MTGGELVDGRRAGALADGVGDGAGAVWAARVT